MSQSFDQFLEEILGGKDSFAMFTPEGDKLVAELVEQAKARRWTWPQTYEALEQLSRDYPDVAGEATDTAVREVVYDKLGFKSNFYC